MICATMGSTYSSIILRCEDQDQVVAAAALRAKCKVWISPPSKGYICVFSQNIEDTELAASLSKHLKCAVLFCVAALEEVFRYSAYVNGKQVDRFDSCPDYPKAQKSPIHGDAEKLSEVFACPKKVRRLKDIISNAHDFPSEQLRQLIIALSMPEWMAGSYEYLTDLQHEHKNIYALGMHVNPAEANTAKKSSANKSLAVLQIAQQSVDKTSLKIGGQFNARLIVVNNSVPTKGLDVRIGGTTITTGMIKPRISTLTGSSAVQPTAELIQDEDGTWFCKLPKKEISGWFYIDIKGKALKQGKGELKVELHRHVPVGVKATVWITDFTVVK